MAKRIIWPVVLAIQAAAVLAVSYGTYQLLWLSPVLYEIGAWALIPLLGALSAYVATVRGLLNYVAWVVPPIMAVLGHELAFFYPPGAGPVFLCAVLSVVGAATGEVVKRRHGDKRRK